MPLKLLILSELAKERRLPITVIRIQTHFLQITVNIINYLTFSPQDTILFFIDTILFLVGIFVHNSGGDIIVQEINYISHFNIIKYIFKEKRINQCLSGYPYIGIGIMLSGRATFTTLDGSVTEIREGEAIYIPKGQIYTSNWEGEPDISFYSIGIDYPTNNKSSHYYPLQKFTLDKKILNTIKEIYELSLLDKQHCYEALGKFYGIYNDITSRLSKARHKSSYIEIMRAVNYIEQNCNADFTVSSLAKLCNMSESKFYAAFKNGTGFSPTDYKNHVRIMRAEQMLAQNSCSVEYVCEQLNFCSPAYFRRVFKQHTNMLPSEIKSKPSSM